MINWYPYEQVYPAIDKIYGHMPLSTAIYL